MTFSGRTDPKWEASTALDLIEKEQLRLVKALLIYPAGHVTGAKSPEQANAARIRESIQPRGDLVERIRNDFFAGTEVNSSDRAVLL